MKRLACTALFALSLAACSAKGNNPEPAGDAATDTPAVDAPVDTASPDVPVTDTPAVDAPAMDAPATDTPSVDAPADTASPDVTDAAPMRCTRDSECTGLTFCSPDGLCVPLVCTPGRLVCTGPNRASVCDGRGATTTDVDCPGGCVLNNCMGMTATCASPRVMCGASCVDAQTSVAHCGRCNNACASGQSCVAGVCTTPCAAPRSTCGDQCVDTQTSAMHCGRCGNACASGQSCVAGVCSLVCAAPTTNCGGACVELLTSGANCGRCGNACASGQTCLNGVCSLVCPGATVACGSVCADLENSVAHCGRCNNACPAGQSCVGGACTLVCPSGQTNCGGVCTSTASSATNCGRCGNACASGQACVSGACTATCASPRALCSGVCTDLTASATNCGRCGNVCASGQSCVAGVCTLVCPTGQTNCGGACVDTNTSAANCGRCANVCAAGQACSSGSCGSSTCPAPRMMCDGACIDVQSNAANCGRCGNVCATGQTCFLGACVSSCAAPRGMCGTSCVDLSTSLTNCGRCGNACGAGQACTNGVCGALPTGGPFRVVSLSASGCRTIEQLTEVGDDRGGIAVNNSHVVYNADGRFARWSSSDLTGYAGTMGPHDGLVSDLSTGAMYVALNEAGSEFAGSTASNLAAFTITQLGGFDASTGALTSTRIRLSTPIAITHDAGFFAGAGFAIIHSGLSTPLTPQRWYIVTLPGGAVTTLPGNGGFSHHVCENGAWWGIAERIAGQYSVVHVRNNTSIVRTQLSNNTQAVIGTYTDIGDTCSITALPASGRWYFHFEGPSELSATGVETTGYCPGTFAFTDP